MTLTQHNQTFILALSYMTVYFLSVILRTFTSGDVVVESFS